MSVEYESQELIDKILVILQKQEYNDLYNKYRGACKAG